MKEFWDNRYLEEGSAYGTEPNVFFKEALLSLQPPGRFLLPAEGEGRNAVYAAQLGWQVTAFDFSNAGQEKALTLAKHKGVQLTYVVANVEEVDFPDEYYDVLGLIYAHFDAQGRMAYHRKLLAMLKKGGKIIFEAYAKEQAQYQEQYGSGGPKDEAMLFSLDEVKTEFDGIQFEQMEQLEINSREGKYHNGPAMVIRFLGIKV